MIGNADDQILRDVVSLRARDLANPSSVFSCHLQWAIFMESFEVFDTSQYAKAYWGQFTYTYMYERQKLPRDKTA